MNQTLPEAPAATRVSQVELMKEAFRYQGALVAYAYGLLRDRALSEDAVQEAFLVLLEKWEEYRPEFGVFGWVRRMVYLKTREILRDRKREVKVADPELSEIVRQAIDEQFDEAAAREFDPLLHAYEECMRGLGEGAARLLTRYYWESQSTRQIADSLKRTANAVLLSLSRIRRSLRECIGRRGVAAGGLPR